MDPLLGGGLEEDALVGVDLEAGQGDVVDAAPLSGVGGFDQYVDVVAVVFAAVYSLLELFATA